MDIINIRSILRKMSSKPKAQRIYNFFEGANVLTLDQILEIEKIIDEETEKVKSFLNKQKTSISE